jgi:hypothetical protein
MHFMDSASTLLCLSGRTVFAMSRRSFDLDSDDPFRSLVPLVPVTIGCNGCTDCGPDTSPDNRALSITKFLPNHRTNCASNTTTDCGFNLFICD